MTLSPKNKLYLIMVLTAALLIGGGFAVWFAFGLILEGNEEIVKLETEQRAIDAQRSRLGEMTKSYESVKDSIPLIDSVLLGSGDQLKFIMLVEQLSARTSVEHVIEAVAMASGSGKEKNPSGEPLIFNINVVGDFSNALKFIYALESASYYVNVDKVYLSAGSAQSPYAAQGAGDQGIVKAQMSVRVYSRL